MKHFLRKLSVLLLLGFPLMLNAQTLTVSTTSISGLTYFQGNGPSSVTSFTVSGSGLSAGYVNVSVPSNFEISTSPTEGFSTYISFSTVGGDLAATPIYVRLLAGKAVGTYSSTIDTYTGAIKANTISISGTVTTPTLSVTPTNISGMTYVLGNGPSAVQSFNVSGLGLTAGTVYASVSSGFEVSTSPTTGFSSSASLSVSSGTLAATPIYVRLAAGKTVGSYTGTISTYISAISASNITLSASVTPPALTAPTVTSATNINSKGFIANWNPVQGAVQYSVKVYQTGTLVGTYTTTSTETSLKISSLLSTNFYYYTVTAIGDNLVSANSLESSSSALIKTLDMQYYMLYQTNFTDWGEVSTPASSSSVLVNFTGGGNGFTADMKPQVFPIGIIGGFTGYYTSLNTNGVLYSKPMDYVNGAIVELTIYSPTTLYSRTVTMSGATNVLAKEVSYASGTNYSFFNLGAATNTLGASTVLDASKLNVWYSGNYATLKGLGYSKILYYMPNLKENDKFTVSGIGPYANLVGLKVYSLVADESVVYVNDLPKESQISFQVSPNGTSQIKAYQIGGFNLTKDVKLSVEGADASFFSLNDTVISASNVLNNLTFFTVTFKPSKFESLKSAKLKISSPELTEPLYFSLIGVTGLNPKVLVSADTIKMWSKLVEKSSYSLKVQGINMPYDVNLTLSGVDVNQFSISKSLISKNEILNGVNVDIQYQGSIEPLIQNASLKISSTGISDIIIPIQGITQTTSPKMYSLSFEANPKGSAIIETSPRGSKFPEGTKVSVKVTPEVGYKMYYWSDGKSGALTSRSVIVSNIKNGLITVNLKPTESATVVEPISLVAYQPTNISTNSFTASWSAISGASNYTVTVYEDGKVVGTPLLVNINSVDITGLNPGVGYSYKVKANTGEESALVGPFSTTAITTSSCTK